MPLRAIFEALGATVEWNEEAQTVTSVRGSVTVSFTIGSNVMTKNGQNITLNVPAQIVGECALVPVRVVAESFESGVDWNENTKTVLINEGAQQNNQPATFALNHTYITQNGAINAVKEINEIIQILSSFRVVN